MIKVTIFVLIVISVLLTMSYRNLIKIDEHRNTNGENEELRDSSIFIFMIAISTFLIYLTCLCGYLIYKVI